ncbi:hypothetical protein [Kitasatospora sp. McL0602]|uniref:hypothetical protein n=1 Tax=Kitasatospora sp. McL0602 TaxID=3439530 RepID=UPI003F8A4CE8
MTRTAHSTGLIPSQRTAAPARTAAAPAPAGEGLGGAVRRAFAVARSAWGLRPVEASSTPSYGESDGQ